MKSLIAALLGAIALMGCATSTPPAQNGVLGQLTSISEPRLLTVRVYSSDLARSRRFYEDVFGLRFVQNFADREWVMFFPDGDRPGIVLALNNPESPRTNGSFAIGVPDIDAAMSRVAANGGAVRRAPPASGSNGFRIAIVSDPDGASIEVIEPAPASRGAVEPAH